MTPIHVCVIKGGNGNADHVNQFAINVIMVLVYHLDIVNATVDILYKAVYVNHNVQMVAQTVDVSVQTTAAAILVGIKQKKESAKLIAT